MDHARRLGLGAPFGGNPIWPFMPTSSWGCMIFDSLIALWFLAGALVAVVDKAAEPCEGLGS